MLHPLTNRFGSWLARSLGRPELRRRTTRHVSPVSLAEWLENRVMLAAEVTNLGFSAPDGSQSDQHLLAFNMQEFAQGGIDLNGDGDNRDAVMHIYDANTATTTNLGLNASNFALSEGLLAFNVFEDREGSGTDLNGDGDAADFVLHVYDSGKASTTNLGLHSLSFQIDGGLVAFTVQESQQGGVDLNGDGDAFDDVVHVYDSNSGELTNLGLAGAFQVDGGILAILVSEMQQDNSDLNDDGDTLDNVLHVYDFSTKTNTNLGLDASRFQLKGNLLAFTVEEIEQGQTDLNGDADASDHVIHVYNVFSDATVNLGLDSSTSRFMTDGELLVFGVEESRQGGTDLNGDNDALDQVLYLYNAGTETTINLGLSVRFSLFQLDGKLLALTVSEQDQGAADLNGDGDASDLVLHTYDANSNTTTNIGLDSRDFQLDGNRLAFSVREAHQGGTDLNGDGDASDKAMHIYDARSGTTTNLGLDASFLFQLEGKHLVFQVIEVRQGGEDLNGDGDATDNVLHAFDAETGAITNYRVAAQLPVLPLDEGRLAFRVSEPQQGQTDLNSDSDAMDFVLHLVDLTVPPRDPVSLLDNLATQIVQLGLDQGLETSLLSLLASAQRSLENDNNDAELRQLNALLTLISAHAGQTMDAEVALLLSEQVEEALACLS